MCTASLLDTAAAWWKACISKGTVTVGRWTKATQTTSFEPSHSGFSTILGGAAEIKRQHRHHNCKYQRMLTGGHCEGQTMVLWLEETAESPAAAPMQSMTIHTLVVTQKPY